jgi:hypothetical protein
MEPDNILEFYPADVQLSLDKNWYGIFFVDGLGIVLWAFFNYGIRDQGFGGWVFLTALLLLVNLNIILFSKQPVKLTLNTTDGTLLYNYIDFFLREKSTTVYLKSAYFEYEPYTTKIGSYMRLLVYNNYFKNKVAIKATKKNGFTREQLDDIAQKIQETQAKLKGVIAS